MPKSTMKSRPVPVIHEGDEAIGDYVHDETPAKHHKTRKRSINAQNDEFDQFDNDSYSTPRIEKHTARTFHTAAEAGSAIQDEIDQLMQKAHQLIDRWKESSHADMAIIQAEAADLYEARNATALNISTAVQTTIKSINEKLESHREEARSVTDSVIKLVQEVQSTFVYDHSISQSTKAQIQHIFSQHQSFKRQKAQLQLADQSINQIQSIVRLLVECATYTSEQRWSDAVKHLFSISRSIADLYITYPQLQQSKVIEVIQRNITQKSHQLTKQLNLALESVLDVQINNKSIKITDDITFSDSSSIVVRFDIRSYRAISDAFTLMESQSISHSSDTESISQSSNLRSIDQSSVTMSNPHELIATSLLDMLIRPMLRFATRKGIAYKINIDKHIDDKNMRLEIQLSAGSTDWFDAVLSITQFVNSCTTSSSNRTINQIVSPFLTGLLPMLVDQLTVAAIPVDVDELMHFQPVGERFEYLEQGLRKIEQSNFSSVMSQRLIDNDGEISDDNEMNNDSEINQSMFVTQTQLSDFVNSVTHHFAQSHRLSVLDQCRDLLLDNSYETVDPSSIKSTNHSFSEMIKNSTPVELPSLLHQSTSQSFFSQSNCAVSISMHQFTLVMWQCAIQAIKALAIKQSSESTSQSTNQSVNQSSPSSQSISQSIIQTIHQSIYLILSIPSVYSVDQLSSVPVITAIFANDTQSVSYHCLKIQDFLIGCLSDGEKEGKLVKHIIASQSISQTNNQSNNQSVDQSENNQAISRSVKQSVKDLRIHVRLVDFVTPLRDLGLHWFRRLVTNIKQSINQSIDQLSSFDDIDQPRTYQSIKKVINQCSHLIGLSNQQLRPVTETKVLGKLIDRLIDWLIDRIVDVSCNVANLSMEGSKNLELILALIDDTAKSMHSKSRKSISQSNNQSVDPSTNQSISQSDNQRIIKPLSIRRLHAVSQFIRHDATLAKLSVEVKQGDYRDLSLQQLTNLTRALYEDSFKRQSFLGLLETQST